MAALAARALALIALGGSLAAAEEAVGEACDAEAHCGRALRADEEADGFLELMQRQVQRREHAEARAATAVTVRESYRARRARLSLLGAARRREDPESSGDQGFAWDQVTKAVQIENITEQLSEATGEVREKLEKELQELKSACPDAEDIEAGLSENWEKVKQAVTVESLQSDMEKAKDFGSEHYQQLKKRYDELTKDVDVQKVKDQVNHQWDQLVQSLPSMDALRESWGQAWGQASDAAHKASDAASDAAHKAWDVVSDWMR